MRSPTTAEAPICLGDLLDMRVEVDDDDLRSLLDACLCDRGADAACGAGDDEWISLRACPSPRVSSSPGRCGRRSRRPGDALVEQPGRALLLERPKVFDVLRHQLLGPPAVAVEDRLADLLVDLPSRRPAPWVIEEVGGEAVAVERVDRAAEASMTGLPEAPQIDQWNASASWSPSGVPAVDTASRAISPRSSSSCSGVLPLGGATGHERLDHEPRIHQVAVGRACHAEEEPEGSGERLRVDRADLVTAVLAPA